MYVITLVSQKGGAGKTTLATHFAAKAVSQGQKAILIDLDPQATAARWGDRRGDLPPDVVTEHASRLETAVEMARAHGYDVAIIDTPANADTFTLRAAKLADKIIIPLRPVTFDLDTARNSLDLCELAKKPTLVVINGAPIRSRIVDDAIAEIERLGGTPSSVIIRSRVALQHCQINGQVASEYEPGGAAAAEINALCAEVLPNPNTRLTEKKKTR